MLCSLLSWSSLILSRICQRRSQFGHTKRCCLEIEKGLELQYYIFRHDSKPFMFKTGPMLGLLRIHPLTRVSFSLRSSVCSRHKCCICCPSSVSRVYCSRSKSFKPASEHNFGKCLVFRQMFEFSLVFLHQVSPLLCIDPSFFSSKASGNVHLSEMIGCFKFAQSPEIFG